MCIRVQLSEGCSNQCLRYLGHRSPLQAYVFGGRRELGRDELSNGSQEGFFFPFWEVFHLYLQGAMRAWLRVSWGGPVLGEG